ncbi:hypothetical protein [Lacticaseibacillus daqingensis]|uniref:hypothetical protein n=1 Tax=Lacticaseibacillus daqingensis TaxID=2486014 RepID=UPI0013DDC6F5|nr:hypothetical protein [Lacticaseibacillus daqingensis]
MELPDVPNFLLMIQTLHPNQRLWRSVADAVTSKSVLDLFAQADQQTVAVFFLPQVVVLAPSTASFGAVDPEQMARDAVVIRRANIRRMWVTAKRFGDLWFHLTYILGAGEQQFDATFNHYGVEDYRPNERNLRYLASNGFYALTEPFQIDHFFELTSEDKYLKIHYEAEDR